MLSNGVLFSHLFENMINGCAHCQAVYDEQTGKLVDWTYLLVNKAFYDKTGFKDVIGKNVSTFLPDLLTTNPRIFEFYECVSHGGKPIIFEEYIPQMKVWFSLSAYSVEDGTFTVVFSDVSEHKLMISILEDAAKRIEHAYDDTLMSLMRALKFRNLETEEHSLRVAELNRRLADEIGIQEDLTPQYWRGALLHDIGKLFISDAILLKPERFSNEEMELVRQHALLGYEFLNPIPFITSVEKDIPHYHHERWDGSGYPLGLEGKEIPMPARVFSVVDVYDAMTTIRPYRKPFSSLFTLKYLASQSGILFDPDVIETFLGMFPEFGLANDGK